MRAWTGRELLVWGGTDGAESLGDGYSYDPRTDEWHPLPAEGAPTPRSSAAAAGRDAAS